MKFPASIKALFLGTAVAMMSACNPDSATMAPEAPKAPVRKDKLIISLLDKYRGSDVIREQYSSILSDSPSSVYYKSDNTLHLSDELHLSQIPVDLSAQQGRKAIVDSVERHVMLHGPMKVLEVVGHGTTNLMGIGDQHTHTTIHNFELLDDLAKLQKRLMDQGKMHKPLAENILLGGCSVFADLSDKDADQYHDFALRLGSRITGSTITVAANYFLKDGLTGDFKIFDGSDRIKTDHKLSDIADYLKNRSDSGRDSVLYENADDIVSQSRWVQRFNKRHAPGQ